MFIWEENEVLAEVIDWEKLKDGGIEGMDEGEEQVYKWWGIVRDGMKGDYSQIGGVGRDGMKESFSYIGEYRFLTREVEYLGIIVRLSVWLSLCVNWAGLKDE